MGGLVVIVGPAFKSEKKADDQGSEDEIGTYNNKDNGSEEEGDGIDDLDILVGCEITCYHHSQSDQAKKKVSSGLTLACLFLVEPVDRIIAPELEAELKIKEDLNGEMDAHDDGCTYSRKRISHKGDTDLAHNFVEGKED